MAKYRVGIIGLGRIASTIDDEVQGHPSVMLPYSHMACYREVDEVEVVAGAKARATRAEGAVDTVITNALIFDHRGIVKADIGLRDGRIVGIGKAGNPDVQPGVTIIVGPGTEAIAGEGKIVTAGAHRQPHPLHLPAADRRGAPSGASPP